MKFPLHVSQLEKWLPHRTPMVWVDEVVSATEFGGECLVRLRSNAHYMSGAGIRQSTLVEWAAQGYGFIRAAQIECGLLGDLKPPTRVFMASVRDARYHVELTGSEFSEGCALHVFARNIKVIEPLFMCDTSIELPNGKLVFEAKLRMFSE